jgi:hypothetical protein
MAQKNCGTMSHGLPSLERPLHQVPPDFITRGHPRRKIVFARKVLLALCAAAFALSTSAAGENARVAQDTNLFTPAPKIDNGLGELPPFATWTDPWVYAVPAESLDTGLGELPPYSEWRYPWVYAMPAEKIDSGLGEIRPITVSEMPTVAERRTQ